jgi:hypothetical protein
VNLGNEGIDEVGQLVLPKWNIATAGYKYGDLLCRPPKIDMNNQGDNKDNLAWTGHHHSVSGTDKPQPESSDFALNQLPIHGVPNQRF